MVSLKVNGKTHSVDVDDDTPLLWVLRDDLGLTGTKFGCGVAMCGACTVFLDGKPLRSCVFPGLGGRRRRDHHHRGALRQGGRRRAAGLGGRDVPQCGYCQSGQVMSAVALLKEVQAAERPRHRPRHERQHLSLCHLRAHPRRDQGRGPRAGGLSHERTRSPTSRRRIALKGAGRPRHRPPPAARRSASRRRRAPARRQRRPSRRTPSCASAPTTP